MLQLIALVAALTGLFYYLFVKPMYYWQARGVKQSDPVWIFGDQWDTISGKMSFYGMLLRCYNQFPNSRYYGMYQFSLPALLIKDPDLLKEITIKNFENFTDHRGLFPEDVEPLWSKNLFNLKGKKWRDMRPILSPFFTSSKMRFMFTLMSNCAEDFANYFLQKKQNFVEIEMKDTFARFTNDVIATTAFGVRVDSLKEPNNSFYEMGKEAADFGGIIKAIKFMLFFTIPDICKRLNIPMFRKAVSDFFYNLVDDTVKTREKNNIIRPDMIHLLMEAKRGVQHKEEKIGVDTGFATAEETYVGKAPLRDMTTTDIAAQAMFFFLAGFESVSTAMCFMSHELAVNPDVQTRLREEIEKTLAECNGKITYEALLKMKYMDMVVSESLRKWPSAIYSDRMCTRPYTIAPASEDEKPLYIEKNILMAIPIIGIHRDPKNYPHPERFDPERFSEENKGKIKPFTYLPFGLGPRNCIGSRFALLEIKLLFFQILSHFELVPVEKTSIPINVSKNTFNLQAEGGFWLGLKRLEK